MGRLFDLGRNSAWKQQAEFTRQWGDLSAYNAEVARGIVHTPEWDEKMRQKQERYNREVLGGGESDGSE